MATHVRSLAICLCLTLAVPCSAYDLADPEASPEARELFAILQRVYGKHALLGARDLKRFKQSSGGRAPALRQFDLSGFNSPPFGESYDRVVVRSIQQAIAWRRTGGIPMFHAHFIHPLNPSGSSWLKKHGKKTASPPLDLKAAVTPGTREHRAVMVMLKNAADAMAKLTAARVPVLYAPWHEIDGGWFWWVDRENPENTAALWRMEFDYFTRVRGLHNIIWVYEAAGHAHRSGPDRSRPDLRRPYYPGDKYVDIVGMSMYPNAFYGRPEPEESAYQTDWDTLGLIAPNKMRTAVEVQRLLNPEKMAAPGGPKWLWVLQWYSGQPAGAGYTDHPFYLTRDEIPTAE